MKESSYQVIARRWRPQQFDEVVGQDHIVRTLKNAIQQRRIAHAYLFVGPRGTGKTSSARLFAKALNCKEGPTVTPCNHCLACQAITEGNSMDVVEIDGASNNSVEQVRQLREDCQYAPAQGRHKIYLIDEVHMLSSAAFNALLKTLEEPPPHVKFIFATTESHKVLPTIVSRCQRFEFRPISDALLADKLVLIAESEKIKVEKKALHVVAHLAQGSMRDAQSILDQMISYCGDTIAEKDVLDVYGLISTERIETLAKAIASADYPALIARVEELTSEGRDLYRALLDLQSFVRQALLEAIREGGRTESFGYPLTTESLMRLLDALHAGEDSVKRGFCEKVNFEVTLLKAVEASRARAIDSLIKELSRLAVDPSPKTKKKKIAEQAVPEPIVEGASPSTHGSAIPESETFSPLHAGTSSQVKEASMPAFPQTEETHPATLPSLDDLVAQIPLSTRKILDEHFRAHFVGVMKIHPRELY